MTMRSERRVRQKKRALGEEKEEARNGVGRNKGSQRKNAQCEDKGSRVEKRPITVLESESGTETEDDLSVFYFATMEYNNGIYLFYRLYLHPLSQWDYLK